MIIESAEAFTSRVREEWLGNQIEVTKTDPVPPVRFQLRDATLVEWDDVDPVIRRRYPTDSRFFVLSGYAEQGGTDGGGALQALIIHVDKGAAFDVRPGRLVLLSNEEVVQVKRLH